MYYLFVLTTADSEDPDKMTHNKTFHQGQHCLLRQKRSSEKIIQFYLEIVTCDPSNHAMDHSKSIASIKKEKSIQ